MRQTDVRPLNMTIEAKTGAQNGSPAYVRHMTSLSSTGRVRIAHLHLPSGDEPNWESAREAVTRLQLSDLTGEGVFYHYCSRLPVLVFRRLAADDNPTHLVAAVRSEIARDLEVIVRDIADGPVAASTSVARISGSGVTVYLLIDEVAAHGSAGVDHERWRRMMKIETPLRAAGFSW